MTHPDRPAKMEVTHTQERHDFVVVHEICPDRPYLEMKVPDNVALVTWVEFHATMHDQGETGNICQQLRLVLTWNLEWMDNKPEHEHEVPSYTFIESSVRRPFGRNDLRPFEELRNRGADPSFYPHTARWELETCPTERRLWMEELKPGDILQLTPKAFFPGWVNCVKCARISIGYLLKEDASTDSVVAEEDLREKDINNLDLPPLNSSRQEIRLLVVEPGKPGDQLRCELVSHSLMNAPQFEALSYCWQGTGGRSMIYIRNIIAGFDETHHSKKVSSNVTDALQKLRFKDQSRIFWIDQLCINQDDHDERASQVSMMGEIYSMASQVHIWLGNGTLRTDLAISLIRDVCNQQFGSCAGGKACDCNGTAHALPSSDLAESLARHNIDPKCSLEVLRRIWVLHLSEMDKDNRVSERPNLLDSMASLFSRPWFQRVWVLQEALGARSAWVHCGKHSAPWEELLAVSGWVDEEDAYHSGKVTMPSIWFNSAMGHQKRNPTGYPISGESRLPFLDVFLHGLNMKATDPRDYIFALLPFGNDTSNSQSLSSLIQPSYTKSVGQDFADFTRWWMITHRSLSILSAITRSQRGRTWRHLHDDSGPRLAHHATLATSLPTWAIGVDGQRNWDDRWTLDPHFSKHFDFRASGDSIPEQYLLKFDLLSGSNLLVVHGFKVTNIQTLSYLEFDPNFETSLDPSLEEMLSVFLGLLDPAGHYRLTSKGHHFGRKVEFPPQIRSRSWGTYWCRQYMDHWTAHWSDYYHSPPPRPLPAYRLVSPSSETGDYIACQSKIIPRCIDPFFFISSNKMVGLCPRPAKQGDIIAVLHGAKVPYLLRPVSNSSQSAKTGPGASLQKYEFIGECYVKGIMRGEYFEQQVDRGRRPDVFTLV